MLRTTFLNSNYSLMVVAVIFGSLMAVFPYVHSNITAFTSFFSSVSFEVNFIASVSAIASFSLALLIAYVSWNKNALAFKASLKNGRA